jgi:hypothetical protein
MHRLLLALLVIIPTAGCRPVTNAGRGRERSRKGVEVLETSSLFQPKTINSLLISGLRRRSESATSDL